MSSHGTILPVAYIPALLLKTLIELGLEYRENAILIRKLKEGFKEIKVDLEVKDENNRSIGFKKKDDNTFEVISDYEGLNREQLDKQRKLIRNIRQRYAYNMLMQELKKKGYNIVEEKKLPDNNIKVIASKWEA